MTSSPGGVPPAFRGWKVGGQVPSADRLTALKLAQARPRPFNPMELLTHTEPRFTVDSVLDGLGFDTAQYSDWRTFLKKALSGNNEVVLRREVMDKAMSERLNPQLRRALLQRSVVHFRGRFQKSQIVNVVSVDELHRAPQETFYIPESLEKAEARGGTYHRRVPRKNGKGYTYYYDPEQYDRSSGAHVDGQSAAKSQIRKGVQKLLEENSGGVGLDSIKPLVKRYGAKLCSDTLREMQKQDGLTFKSGRLGLKTKKEAT